MLELRLGKENVSLLERCPYIRGCIWGKKSVLIREVSLYQRLHLEKEKVSLLERCPCFRGVLREGFPCIM